MQNALSFLQNLPDPQSSTILVRKNSSLEVLGNSIGTKVLKAPNTPLKRIIFEINAKKLAQEYSIIFSIFGTPFLNSHPYFLNINGFAVSNLLYPEIDFWKFCSRSERIKHEIIDFYRRKMYRQADFWIFETDILRQRAVDLFQFPEAHTAVVKMAPSSLVSPQKIELELCAEFEKKIGTGKFRFLFLNGANPNKRIHLLPSLAKTLYNQGVTDFIFITTLPLQHSYTLAVKRHFYDINMQNHWCNIGPVAQSHVASLIACSDVMCTFSVLESFSNNFVEAWKMSKPLIVTNSDWAKASCKGSALYLDPEQTDAAAEILKMVYNQPGLRQRMILAGEKILKEYPTSMAKNQYYLEAIKKACELGKLSQAERKKITL